MNPEFITPEPTTVEQTGPDEYAIYEDSGYRANVEYEHEPCGDDGIEYLSTRLSKDPAGAGWKCRQCGSLPDKDIDAADRVLLRFKVTGIMLDMHYVSKEVYVSNHDQSEVVTGHVMRKCVEADDYSEAFIIDAIKEELK